MFVKNKYSASKNNQTIILLCKTCEQSNLNCKIIYNKLFLKETKVNSKEEKCSNCGIRLTSSNSSVGLTAGGGGRRNKKYGKVQREQDDLNDFNIDSPTPIEEEQSSYKLPSTNTIDDKYGAKEAGMPIIGNDKSILDKKVEGTGIAFDPNFVYSIDESIDNDYYFDDHNNVKNNSFQTVLEVQDEEEEEVQEMGEEKANSSEPNNSSETNNNNREITGNRENRWAKSARKVWKTQRVVELLRQAGKQVSNQVKAGKQTIVNGVNGARQQVFNEFNNNNNNNNSNNNVSADTEEPEFYNSRILRSAEIQM